MARHTYWQLFIFLLISRSPCLMLWLWLRCAAYTVQYLNVNTFIVWKPAKVKFISFIFISRNNFCCTHSVPVSQSLRQSHSSFARRSRCIASSHSKKMIWVMAEIALIFDFLVICNFLFVISLWAGCALDLLTIYEVFMWCEWISLWLLWKEGLRPWIHLFVYGRRTHKYTVIQKM